MISQRPFAATVGTRSQPVVTALGQVPLLVGAAVAVPDLQLGTVGGVTGGVVQTTAGLRVDQAVVGLRLPNLGTGTVTTPQLDQGAVSGTTESDIQTLAQRT